MSMQTLDRSRIPAPGVPRDVTFPDYFEQRLPNGLKVIVYEDHTLPLVSVNQVEEDDVHLHRSAPVGD